MLNTYALAVQKAGTLNSTEVTKAMLELDAVHTVAGRIALIFLYFISPLTLDTRIVEVRRQPYKCPLSVVSSAVQRR